MGWFANVGTVLLKIKGAVMATTATKVATAVVAATIVVGGTVGAVQTEVFASPEKKVENALESLVENEEGAFGALLGFRELFKAMLKEGTEAGFDLTLKDVPMDDLGLSGFSLPNMGLGVTYRFDAKKEQTGLLAGVKVADTTLLSASVYADKEKVMASVPQLLDGYIGAYYADSAFGQKLKESELAGMLGEEYTAMLESLTESMNAPKNPKETLKTVVAYLAAVKESKDDLFASMEAERNGEATVLVNGEEVQCKVYKATFGPEEVEAFLTVLIDETVLLYDSYVKENMDPALVEELEARKSSEEVLEEIKAFKEELKGQIAETTLEIYMNGKRLIMADADFVLKEGTLNLNVMFGAEGNRYDNMHLTLYTIVEGATETLFELIHKTEDTEVSLFSEWRIISEDREVFRLGFSYLKQAGDFTFSVMLPAEHTEFEVKGVLTVPVKGKELAFELSDISFTEYDEKVSLGFQTEFYLKVLDGEIAEPEEMKWDVVSMTAVEWEKVISEVKSNLYSMAMKLLFGGYSEK